MTSASLRGADADAEFRELVQGARPRGRLELVDKCVDKNYVFDFCRRLKNPVTSTAGTMKQLTSFLAYDTHNIEHFVSQTMQ